jgi:hypothetical protein
MEHCGTNNFINTQNVHRNQLNKPKFIATDNEWCNYMRNGANDKGNSNNITGQ